MRRAFTLIELLVVIAIIAILAAILFPVFAKARERANSTTCASNLHQFGAAFMSYADDYDGRLPSPGGSLTYRSSWWNQDGTTIQRYIARGERTVKSPPLIWSCPSYLARFPTKSGNRASRNYSMNAYLRGAAGCMDVEGGDENTADAPSPWETGILLSQVKEPVRTILLYESAYNTDKNDHSDKGYGYGSAHGRMDKVMGYKDVPYNDLEKPISRAWHNDRNNYLWCDGHVSSMRPETRTQFPDGHPDSSERNNWYAQKRRF